MNIHISRQVRVYQINIMNIHISRQVRVYQINIMNIHISSLSNGGCAIYRKHGVIDVMYSLCMHMYNVNNNKESGKCV
jgi:hypothetical protein